MADLGSLIRGKRKALGISVAQLAAFIGIPKDRIYKWEKGTKPSDVEDYNRISDWISGKLEYRPNGNMDYTPITTTQPKVRIAGADEKERLILQLQNQVRQLEDEVKFLRNLVTIPSENRH